MQAESRELANDRVVLRAMQPVLERRRLEDDDRAYLRRARSEALAARPLYPVPIDQAA